MCYVDFMKMGLLGGTGAEGRGLAVRLGLAGFPVVIGSRSADRAVAAARACNEMLGRPAVEPAENAAMLRSCGVVFLTVPYEEGPRAVAAIGADLRAGQILVDVTVPMRFREGRAEHVEIAEGSCAERLARILPEGVLLVAAFKTLPAHVLGDPAQPLECDDFVCGDDEGARARVIEIAGRIPGLRALDAGPLNAARALERMTVLVVHLNRTCKKKGARFRVVGL